MWKTLSIVAAILTAGAAFFSFKTVQQFKNERQLLKIAQDNKVKVEKHLEDVQAALAANVQGREKTEGEITAVEKQIADLKTKVDDLTKQVDEKKTELENVTSRWTQVKKQVDEADGIEELKNKLTSLSQEKSMLDEKVAGLKTRATLATERFNNLTKTIAALRAKEAWQARGIIQDGFRASIVQVDRTYGFITINAGNGSGVVSGATLDIRRGGEVVGQARVTNVEQRYAVADLVTPLGATPIEVNVGDSVVVSATSSSKNWRDTPPAPAAPSATPAQPSAPADIPPAAPADPFAADPAAQPSAPAAPPDPFADPSATAPSEPSAPATEPAPAQPLEPAPPADPNADPFAN